MSVVDLASSTGMWVKQVTTSFFSKGSKMFRNDRLANGKVRTAVFALSLITWTGLGASAYFQYRLASEHFYQEAEEQVHRALKGGGSGGHGRAVDLTESLSHRLGPFIELGERSHIRKIIEQEAQGVPKLHHLAILGLEDGRMVPIAHLRSPAPPPSRTTEVSIDGFGPTAEVWVLPDEVLLRLSSDILFLGRKRTGQVDLWSKTGIENPLPAFRTRMIAFGALSVFLVPIFFLLLLNTLSTATRRTRVLLSLKRRHIKEAKAFIPILISVLRIWKEEVRTAADADVPPLETYIGPYLIRDKIATGGMAEVYVAERRGDDGFRKVVALKKILPHLAGNPEFIGRFSREARIAALLQHPNIAATHTFAKNDSIIEMEYVHGKNLAQIMARVERGLQLDQVVFIISKVCRALHYAHQRADDATGERLRIIHRDISPQNILVSFEGEVKLTDFGIVKANVDSVVTQTGAITGKIDYLTPEQVTIDGEVDARTDLYALGIVFYELLSGERLFRFKSVIEAVNNIPTLPVRPIREQVPSLPGEINGVVMKMLEKDKDRRYQTAAELLDDLERIKHLQGLTYGMSDLSRFMHTCFPSGETGVLPATPHSAIWLRYLLDLLEKRSAAVDFDPNGAPESTVR